MWSMFRRSCTVVGERTPQLSQSVVVLCSLPKSATGSSRDPAVRFSSKSVSQAIGLLQCRRFLSVGALALISAVASIDSPAAQTIDARQWQGAYATSRQPEHLVASTVGEWRSLWARTGLAPPDLFEPGRTNAIGIFLGRRAAEGYSVNVLSTTRRRDRIVIVFEERMPPDVMLAQRAAPRAVAGAGAPSLGSGSANFAAPSASASATIPVPAHPVGKPTSPWAIILINRADLPVSVEQRIYR